MSRTARMTMLVLGLMSAAGSRRGSRSRGARPSMLAGLSTWSGQPVWGFDIPHRIRGRVMVRRYYVSLGGKLVHKPSFSPRIEREVEVDQLAVAAMWRDVEALRPWSEHLLGLDIDWSQPLYVRKGQWSSSSKVFLDQQQPERHGYDRVTERRYESGVSVLRASAGRDSWAAVRPDSRQAIYRLPDDYMRSWKALDMPTWLLQGERVTLGEHYTDDGEGPFPVYEYGADGEPLLVAETIRVIEQLDPQTLRPA